ncbi:DNA-3-methyladenine glycosylase family protein [Ezakiella coagulans]|uniref:DNA-3-methyladenine glycosylase family protein n=1 Tax=Ezakiella coagulans TaxID=46507 RepID=UPI00288A7D8F|nr:DNA-3-methyladenine glycosylase [Ezakiella coagulans]
MYFKYGEKEISYLKNKDKKLAEVIEKVGLIERETDPELFSALVHHIVGQQISTKAQATIWERMKKSLGAVTPETILNASMDEIRSFGISLRKVEYIKDFAEKVHTGEFDIEAAEKMEDDELIKYLTTLKGVGVWTAEMILLFCLQRPNVFSFDDLAIQRGLRMVYHHRKIDRKLFEKYRRRFSPYCSVASLYLWAVSNGAIPEMRDYAPKTKGDSRKGF